MRHILHIDMDAFYASVEQRDNPDLRGRPVIVGGSSRRGVVCAASYEARPFGVHSAQPMSQAIRRCPDAIVVRPRMAHYEGVSSSIFRIFKRFTPLVEGLSIDEAFLDVTGSQTLFGDGRAIAMQIREAIQAEIGLPASAGVAPSKFVAKIASAYQKPDALVVVPESRVTSFLRPLPIEKMWGLGKKTVPRLRSLGFVSFGDLADANPNHLEGLLGRWGREVHRLARGLDTRPVVPGRDPKSIGAEVTYDENLRTREEVERTLLAHATRVARRLNEDGWVGRCVTVKLKFADFTVQSRQRMLAEPIGDAMSIYETACDLLGRFDWGRRGIRLTGISVGALEDAARQQRLFVDPVVEKREKVQQAIADIESRFGIGGLTRAALLSESTSDE